jgi:hypothetical protein
MKKIFGNFLVILHYSILPISISILIYYECSIYLLLLLLCFTSIIINWIIFGYCIFTPIENYLLEKDEPYENNSAMASYIEKYLNIDKNLINNMITFFPLVMIFLILLKIYYTYIKT